MSEIVRRPDPTVVWLTEWQVSEDGLDVRSGQAVEWMLVVAASRWIADLFDGRRRIDLELDTYADVGHVPTPELVTVAGTVELVESVEIDQEATLDGRVPVAGSARTHRVESTSDARGTAVEGFLVTLRAGATSRAGVGPPEPRGTSA